MIIFCQIYVLRTIRVLLADAYHRTNAEMDPIRQAREFRQEFENAHGSNYPDFVENGWKEASAQAHQDCKFLWVYIHAAEHEVRISFDKMMIANFDTKGHLLYLGFKFRGSPMIVKARPRIIIDGSVDTSRAVFSR